MPFYCLKSRKGSSGYDYQAGGFGSLSLAINYILGNYTSKDSGKA